MTTISLRSGLRAAALAGVLALAGCATDSYRNTATGAVIGTVVGAGVGAVIGHQSGRAGEGAAIGGAAGAVIGGVAGNTMDQRETREKRTRVATTTPAPANERGGEQDMYP
jgi:uncharacterized membrane protein